MQELFGLSAFRLTEGACVCGAVPPRVISGFHGDIRLESASGDRKTDEYCVWTFVGKRTRKFVVHRARTPDGQHMRTLAGRRLHPRLSACGLCTLSFIIINHKLRLTAGRLRLRVCAFAAVCGISSVRGFFIYRRAARISPDMRNFAGIVFCREAHLRTALPSSAEKFFPAVARCRAKVSFRRIFRSDRGGRKCVRQSSEKRHILQV